MKSGGDEPGFESADLSIAMLGVRGYREMSAVQENLVTRRQRGEIGDLLLVLEHPATYTRGRRSEAEDLHHDPGWYRERGIEVFDSPRGGRVTYHGPGQLVAYPIIDLSGLDSRPGRAGPSGVAGFVASLEAAMVAVAARWGVSAGTIQGLTGIWTAGDESIPPEADADSMAGAVAGGLVRKIGSIGLRINRDVTSHGVSMNIDCDLEPFSGITSCGIDQCRVSSILAETGESPAVGEAGLALGEELGRRFNRDPVIVSPEWLGLHAGLAANP